MVLLVRKQVATGRAYAAARVLTGLDQRGLADRAGLSASTISNLEAGAKVRPASVDAVHEVLEGFGIPVNVTGKQRAGMLVLAARYEAPPPPSPKPKPAPTKLRKPVPRVVK